ncbi:unnamed protein product [Gadus morhua 'NCC']
MFAGASVPCLNTPGAARSSDSSKRHHRLTGRGWDIKGAQHICPHVFPVTVGFRETRGLFQTINRWPDQSRDITTSASFLTAGRAQPTPPSQPNQIQR